MALTGWNTDAATRLYRASVVVDAEPWIVSAWGNTPDLSASQYIAASGQLGLAANARRLQVQNTSGKAFISSIAGAGSSGAVSTVGSTINTWNHFGAEFISTSSRAALTNGAGRASDATLVTPASADGFFIGNQPNDGIGPCWDIAGGVAEVSVWDGTGMSNANMDSLIGKLYNGGAGGAGGNPLNINAESGQPWTGKLLAYWPLTSTSDLADASGHGLTLTLVGAITNFASHPTIEAVSTSVMTPGLLYRMRRRRNN